MKVAFVHSFYSSRQSSGENVVVEAQIAALRDRGVEVQLIAARTDDLENTRGYAVRAAITVATGRGRSPLSEIQEFAPDIVHVHNLFPNWGTDWLNRWSGPVVASLHNFRPVCASGTLFRDGGLCTECPDTNSGNAIRHGCYRGSRVATVPLAIRNRRGISGDRLLQRANRVVLLSERAQTLYEGFGLDARKIEIVPNFVEDIGFAPASPAGLEWVFIGRLTPEKGIANLINHWPRTEMLGVYGEGPLRSELEASARPNIRFYGNVDHADIPTVLANARGLVFPSEWAEGFPLVYAEGLASGRAVVAKSGNSAADDIARGLTGQIFEEWADVGTALLRATAQQPQLGIRARARYDDHFTQEVWLESMMGVYDRVMHGGPN